MFSQLTDLDLRLIRVFLAIVDAGGVSPAQATLNVGQSTISTQLATLETMIYPTSAQLNANDALAQIGTLEIIPMETPLALFVWSQTRILPVRVTELSITEEAFDTSLNPIRAKVSLGLRVLSVNDVPTGHKAASLFMSYLQQKERLAGASPVVPLSALGITGVP